METGVIYQPELDGKSFDVVIVGLGPAGIHLSSEIQRCVGSAYKTIALEQNETCGGSAHASMQQARTLQTHPEMARMVGETIKWYRETGGFNKQKGTEARPNWVSPLPYLFVAGSKAQLDGYRQNLTRTREWGYGAQAEILGPDELQYRYPFIDRSIVAGGLYYPDAFSLDFEAAMQHILTETPRTTFATGTRMSQVLFDKDRVVGIKTDRGEIINTPSVVLTTGPFIIQAPEQIGQAEIPDLIQVVSLTEVRRRQRFSAPIKGSPVDQPVFVVSPFGAYARYNVDSQRQVWADYGFADPNDPLVTYPEPKPKPDPFAFPYSFPNSVYLNLGTVISSYGNEESFGPWAVHPQPNSGEAGYYSDTPADLPIVTRLREGLVVGVGFGHAGVMNRGAATLITEILFNCQTTSNAFSLQAQRKSISTNLRL